jgi:cell division protein FtsL
MQISFKKKFWTAKVEKFMLFSIISVALFVVALMQHGYFQLFTNRRTATDIVR